MPRRAVITCAALTALASCIKAAEPTKPAAPEYLGIETRLLDGDLVGFIVTMRNPRNTDDLAAYADCAAAQYALIRNFGFARHLRTNISEKGGAFRADAVYTISPDLPRGVKTIDAEVVAAECANQGIPRV